MPNFTDNSPRWLAFDLVARELADDPSLQRLPVVRNPRTAQQLDVGEQVLILRWGGDSLQDWNAGHQRRTFRLSLGCISRKANADRDADAIHHAAGKVMQRALAKLGAAIPGCTIKSITEQDTTPDVEGIEIVGAVVLSSWQIEYQLRRAN